ncbi:hypothetical protein BTVI_84811 [Pitangus sulphuratus]|nr:hypothetical protein BTVI_84811 [Pitangus sulphuratus]
MRNKQEKLEALVQSQRFDIIDINETWWDETCDWIALLDGYRLFRRDRQGRRGGGVELCVIEFIECMELTVGNGTAERFWVFAPQGADKRKKCQQNLSSGHEESRVQATQGIKMMKDRGSQCPELEGLDCENDQLPVNSETVWDLLLRLDPYNSMRPDGLNPRILKELADVITKSLSMLLSSLGNLERSQLTGSWQMS